MNTQQNLTVVQGYIVALPRHDANEENALVAVVDEQTQTEYYIIPRGMGADLSESINVGATISGVVHEKEGVQYIQVRTYKLADEFADEWYDDED